MPSRVIDTMPSTMKLMMTIVAKTGRLMEVLEIHIWLLAEWRWPVTGDLVGSGCAAHGRGSCWRHNDGLGRAGEER
jgi:hypothetical protein